MITRLLEKIFTALFPAQCIICHSEETSCNICQNCIQQLTINRDLQLPWIFSLYHYKDERVHICIHHLKNYPDELLIHEILSHKKLMIIGWITGIITYYQIKNIVLVPTPIHHSRFVDRGYNQSEIIAKGIRKILEQTLLNISISIHSEIVRKNKKTEKQALIMDREKRFKNVVNIFTTTGREAKLPAQTLIVIIDDVTTTGGTLQEIYNQFPYHHVVAFTLAH